MSAWLEVFAVTDQHFAAELRRWDAIDDHAARVGVGARTTETVVVFVV